MGRMRLTSVECQQNVVALRGQKVPTSYHYRRGRAIEAGDFVQSFAALDFFANLNLAGAENPE